MYEEATKVNGTHLEMWQEGTPQVYRSRALGGEMISLVGKPVTQVGEPITQVGIQLSRRALQVVGAVRNLEKATRLILLIVAPLLGEPARLLGEPKAHLAMGNPGDPQAALVTNDMVEPNTSHLLTRPIVMALHATINNLVDKRMVGPILQNQTEDGLEGRTMLIRLRNTASAAIDHRVGHPRMKERSVNEIHTDRQRIVENARNPHTKRLLFLMTVA